MKTFFSFAVLLLLSACGPAVEGIDKGVDVVEVRTFTTPTLINDLEKGTSAAEPLIEVIGKIDAVSQVPDSEVRTENAPYIRLTLLNDEAIGKYKLIYALLLLKSEGNSGLSSYLYFRSRDENNWNFAKLSDAISKELFSKIDSAIETNFSLLSSLDANQIDAVRSSIVKVSASEGLFDENIKLISIDAVDWPNAALGFPEPGKAYAMMIVPGYKIILQLPNGKKFECHTGSGRVEFAPIN